MYWFLIISTCCSQVYFKIEFCVELLDWCVDPWILLYFLHRGLILPRFLKIYTQLWFYKPSRKGVKVEIQVGGSSLFWLSCPFPSPWTPMSWPQVILNYCLRVKRICLRKNGPIWPAWLRHGRATPCHSHLIFYLPIKVSGIAQQETSESEWGDNAEPLWRILLWPEAQLYWNKMQISFPLGSCTEQKGAM